MMLADTVAQRTSIFPPTRYQLPTNPQICRQGKTKHRVLDLFPQLFFITALEHLKTMERIIVLMQSHTNFPTLYDNFRLKAIKLMTRKWIFLKLCRQTLNVCSFSVFIQLFTCESCQAQGRLMAKQLYATLTAFMNREFFSREALKASNKFYICEVVKKGKSIENVCI